MATFTITVEDRNNLPPDQVGNLKLQLSYNELYIFSFEDFTTNTNPVYSDPENDDPFKLKILDYPDNNSNQLLLNGVEVVENQEITFVDIVSGNLLFQADDNILTSDSFSFTFTISDIGSEQFSEDSGNIKISIAEKQNEPPTEVGDGNASLEDTEILVFTSDMFTNTTPAYSDPESDPPSRLRIISLPDTGEILLNNIPIIASQVINFEEVIQGNLVYVPNDVNEQTLSNFEFELADSGSNIFVG
jgi:hypothetical protein